ncbi:hypothetical protein TWF481_005314 [Arthrobotrys musiformis]|uniref:F-box domain-containing protein n=1 Tax=Arthrobotrys musiformis TaxID=47236 RepID=A0AAV9WDC5_9PEZI
MDTGSTFDLSDLEPNLPKSSGFVNLPTEIHLAIINHIPDSEKLAHCSKYFYFLCLERRFSGVFLRPAAKVFGDGGLCATGVARGAIRALRFENAWEWREAIGLSHAPANGPLEGMNSHFANTCASIEALNLDLFPNIRKLYISYYVPECAANNFFLASLRGIARCGFRDVLEFLEVQVFAKSTYFTRFDYSTFRGRLSEQHGRLLGDEVTHDELDKLVETEIPEMRALKVVKIFYSAIARPFDSFSSYRFRATAAYYRLLTLAPRLEGLYINTESPGSKRPRGSELYRPRSPPSIQTGIKTNGQFPSLRNY